MIPIKSPIFERFSAKATKPDKLVGRSPDSFKDTSPVDISHALFDPANLKISVPLSKTCSESNAPVSRPLSMLSRSCDRLDILLSELLSTTPFVVFPHVTPLEVIAVGSLENASPAALSESKKDFN